MGSGSRGVPAGFITDVQTVVGKLGLPHFALAAVTAVISVVTSSLLMGGTGATGPAGPAGAPATKAPIGVCIYYGLNEAGKGGMHLLTPSPDGTCTKGWYLSLKPGN